MTTAKKTTQISEEQSAAVATSSPSKEEIEAQIKTQFESMVQTLEAFRKSAEAQGVVFEQPPTETTVVRDIDPVQSVRRPQPGELIDGFPRPWTKEDLTGQDKFPLVPKAIPGAVHPIPDADGRYHIFLDVNGLTCCLTVNELNTVSGMFYHAYMNIEDQWRTNETFKKKGPKEGPHVNGGLNGINTWMYVGEAPSAWIDLDGQFYSPGSEMPLDDIPESRPA